MKGYLLVRVDGKAYGLPVNRVLEVSDPGDVRVVPRSLPAVRGLTALRGRLVPLIHLGALLEGRAAPAGAAATPGGAVVLVQVGTPARAVAFEVDDADAVVREQPLPVPGGQSLPWAAGVAEQDGALVPILDLDALGDRIP
ncbi:MAG: chemotaxis protein CheW [Geminicoccales bacterium]